MGEALNTGASDVGLEPIYIAYIIKCITTTGKRLGPTRMLDNLRMKVKLSLEYNPSQ